MRVGIMARSLKPPLTGIGRYTLNLARALSAELHPDAVTLFVTREASANGIQAKRVRCPVPTPHEALRAMWEHTVVPFEVSRHTIDVYHSPNYTIPVGLIGCPAVVTVHDMAFMDDRFHNKRLQLYLRLLTGFAVRRAARIIAVSEYTRRRLEDFFPEARGKTTVVYSGLEPAFASRAQRPEKSERRMHSRPYLLFTGTIEPRKNLPRLVRAFEQAIDATGAPHDLAICGPVGWRSKRSLEAIHGSRLRSRILHPGYVPESDLPEWYAGASALLYPSLDEGFGFPIIEAMAVGTPVVTSNCAAMPEVAGDAAELVDPRSVASMASGIVRVLTDSNRAAELREKGPPRARSFTWESAARQTLETYRQAMGGRD